ncbi:hypothetical protein V8C34DRAFT_269985 [Trichoderma compactum]
MMGFERYFSIWSPLWSVAVSISSMACHNHFSYVWRIHDKKQPSSRLKLSRKIKTRIQYVRNIRKQFVYIRITQSSETK